jgi:hypothetical protein
MSTLHHKNRATLSYKSLSARPSVYLAGKIRKHCWRHRLVSGLRDHTWSDGVLQQEGFVYLGPFFVGCDHGCFHNKNSHGAVAIRGNNLCPGRDINSEFDGVHQEVTNLCMAAVKKADILFCYIDSLDCFGTLVEVGFAIAHNVPVIIAFAPSVASPVDNDFWFPCVSAKWVIYNVNTWELPEYLKHALRRYA